MIKELKEISNVPIVGNGDITTPEDAKDMIDNTGCDYIMIGRGAVGNPFLFEQINDFLKTGSYKKYSFTDKLDSFFDYLDKIKFANIKGQAIRFTKGMVNGAKLRTKISTSRNLDDLKKIMYESYSKINL